MADISILMAMRFAHRLRPPNDVHGIYRVYTFVSQRRGPQTNIKRDRSRIEIGHPRRFLSSSDLPPTEWALHSYLVTRCPSNRYKSPSFTCMWI